MNQVTTIEPADLTAEFDGLLAVIANAARDPNVDVDKMGRLLEMQERVLDRRAYLAYHASMSEMQPKLPVISERGKILNKQREVQSTYALWEDINEILKPILQEHGFDLAFKGRKDGADYVTVGILTHRLGHSEETEVPLPRDDSGNKNAVQSIGSAKSYGKRYAAFDLLNITTKGEDDDGQAATRYRADNSPMPRAKLDGPYTSKTALRTAVHAIIAKVRAAQSNEEIDAALKEGKDARKQAERDWPALINGDPKWPEDTGLRGAVADARALLAEDGQLTIMIRSMKECDTKLKLANWRAANEEAIEMLDGAESRRFQLAWDMHESAVNLMDTARA